ncbi:MAG TPA: hypothetical protein VN699_12925 [Pirellulales bacterium]|nr:hypothetical protein [Pirellulales bacterium]
MNFARTVVAVGLLAAAAWQIPAVQAQVTSRAISPGSEVASGSVSERIDPWRYKYHDGHWWYWLPSNSWVFYDNQRWVPYSRRNYSRSLQADRAAGWQGVAYRGFRDSTSANQWPRGDNGSSPYASPQPGGAPVERSAAAPPRGRWPRDSNGSDPNASPEPGGAGAERQIP